MDYVAASDTCIQCHSQGQPVSNPIEGKYYDWPVGYNVGGKLADHWKLEDHTLGEPTNFLYFPDGTAHKNRMQGNDFVQSVMYRRGVTCFDCHDVHGTDVYAQLRKPADKLCLDCHAPLSANGPRTATLEEHTHHKAGSPGNNASHVICLRLKQKARRTPWFMRTRSALSRPHDGPIQDPESLYFLPQGQDHAMGHR
jgi:predicted CXXCH cytochrome family protein